MEVEPQLIQEYVATGKAKIIYRHLAQLGDDSVRAAEGMDCAGDQGRFWEMRYTLYERQGDLYQAGSLDGALQFLAGELGMDTDEFAACLSEGRHREAVAADYRAAQDEGVRQRPTFDVNGQRLVGFQPFEEFQRRLEP